jgi:hypothetical protein
MFRIMLRIKGSLVDLLREIHITPLVVVAAIAISLRTAGTKLTRGHARMLHLLVTILDFVASVGATRILLPHAGPLSIWLTST